MESCEVRQTLPVELEFPWNVLVGSVTISVIGMDWQDIL